MANGKGHAIEAVAMAQREQTLAASRDYHQHVATSIFPAPPLHSPCTLLCCAAVVPRKVTATERWGLWLRLTLSLSHRWATDAAPVHLHAVLKCPMWQTSRTVFLAHVLCASFPSSCPHLLPLLGTDRAPLVLLLLLLLLLLPPLTLTSVSVWTTLSVGGCGYVWSSRSRTDGSPMLLEPICMPC